MTQLQTNASASTISKISLVEQTLLSISHYINISILPVILKYTLGPTILLSFLNNAIVILVFLLNKKVISKITKSVRIYYIAISLADICDTITVHIRYWGGDGLSDITNGGAYFYMDQLSVVSCKLVGVFYVCSESYTQWLLAYLMGERLAAMYFPFHTKRLATTRNALLVCLVEFIIILLTIMLVVALAINLVPDTASRTGFICVFTGDALLSWFSTLVAGCGVYFYPLVVMLGLGISLAVKLVHLSKERAKFMTRATDDSSKEVNAAVVMLVLVIMHCCVYLPNAVFWITWDFGAILGGFSGGVSAFILSGGFLFLYLTIVAKCWNLYIYMARVPQFARGLFNWCGLDHKINALGNRINSRGGERTVQKAQSSAE